MITQILRIKDIIYSARKHLNIIISMTVAGLLVGILFYFVQRVSVSNQTRYNVFVSIALDAVSESGRYSTGVDYPTKDDFSLASTLIDAITYIARSEKVCKTAVERLNLIGVTTKSVQNALSLTQYGSTSIVELSLIWTDPDEGLEIMYTILDILPGAMRDILNLGSIRIIENPVVTTIAASTSSKNVLIFPVLGFLGSMLYCFAQLYIHPTLIDIKDVGELFNISTLSVIEEDPGFDQYLRENLITNRANLSASMKENYTALAHILLHQIEDEYFSFFVTSSIRGEGKTTVAANLGIALAALDKRVLLIDFDLSDPSLGSFFTDNINYKNTVNAVYFDDTSVGDALVQVSRNLYILMAVLDKRHIGIDRFAKKLVAQMETEFDIVILDTPPLGESADTLYFNNVSKNALYVMRYDYAGCDVIGENLEKLNKTGTSVLGAIVNRVPQNASLASSTAKSMEDEEENSLLDSIRQKIPFLKKKIPDAPRLNAGHALRAESLDEFDSDDDLVDPEDYLTYVPRVPAEKAEAKAPARKNTADYSDDSDDERIAYVEAAEMDMVRREGRKQAAAEEDAEEAEPEGRAAPEEPRRPKATEEPKQPEKSGQEPVQADASVGQPPAVQAEQPEMQSSPPKQPKKQPPKQPVPPKPADVLPPEDEDEDARFARLFGTQVNHYHDEDDL